MNVRHVVAYALLISTLPLAASAGGRGGFDFHGDTGHPQSYSHSSTGPAGTSRTTTASNTGNGYNRNTTASNGNYNRNVNASASNGQYNRNTSASNGYAQHNSSSYANANTGNYGRTASGSNAYGSYHTTGGGNAYNGTYAHSTTGTNVYGQTYHGSTTAYGGTAYHSAYVTNPVYGAYPAWGWNAGVAWYPAPYYYGGGFWGAMAIGVASAAVYGSIVAANSQTITSYQVQPESPGAKLLASYKLTQTPCGPAGLVVIYGPNSSAICAQPNGLVAAGYYNVDSSNLTIVSLPPS